MSTMRGILSICAAVFGGCVAQFTLDGEEVTELKMKPDREVAFLLANDDIVDAKRFQYVYATDSTDGILGKGTRTVAQTGEVSEFRGFLHMTEIDSLFLREGRWQCWAGGGTLVNMREEDAVRVMSPSHPGFWIVGASQRRQSGIPFCGFLPDSTITEIKANKVSLVGTVVLVAISTGVVALAAVGLAGGGLLLVRIRPGFTLCNVTQP
jgi:hypothetical protein